MPAVEDLILTRPVPDAPPSAPLPSNWSSHLVSDASDTRFAALDAFYTNYGFPAGWAARLLAHTGRATLLLDDDAHVAATAWIFRAPFYIDEIRRSFRPDPDADYYFGDFVSPAHRGKGLQRALISLRLGQSVVDTRRWAVAMTRSDNRPSLANYEALGFAVAARLSHKILGPVQIDTIRCVEHSLHGRLSTEGFPLTPRTRLRRRR